MADESVAQFGENSPERQAYKLMQEVAQVERIVIGAGDLPAHWTRAGRAWILDTYQECLYAVTNPKKPSHQW